MHDAAGESLFVQRLSSRRKISLASSASSDNSLVLQREGHARMTGTSIKSAPSVVAELSSHATRPGEADYMFTPLVPRGGHNCRTKLDGVRAWGRERRRSPDDEVGHRSETTHSDLRHGVRVLRLGMAGRVNHRGWIVLESAQSSSDGLCVDFFEHPDGGFGFEQFRRDPEDRGSFTQVSYFSAQRFPSVLEAVAVAQATIDWLKVDPIAARQLKSWIESQPPQDGG